MTDTLSVRELSSQVTFENTTTNNNNNNNNNTANGANNNGNNTITGEKLVPLIKTNDVTYYRVCNPSLPTEEQRNGFLGSGGFGQVFHARRIIDGKSHDFAIKKIDITKIDPKDIERQKREFELATCAKIDSPYLVRMEAVIADGNFYYIVMEMVKGGHDLSKELRAEPYFEPNQNAPRFPPEKAHKIFYKLVMGVMALHRNGVVHRDLKLKNILFERETNRPLICDFGLTNYFVEGDRHFSDVGTIDFADPNVVTAPLNGRLGYSAVAADVWSLGVILHVMLTGFLPFPDGGCLYQVNGVFKLKTPNYLVNGHEARRILLQIPAALHLVHKMLEPLAVNRISLNEILENPWFRENFDPAELSRIPNPPAVAATFAKAFRSADEVAAEQSGTVNAVPLPPQLQNGNAPPGFAIQIPQHAEQIDTAIQLHVVPQDSAKSVKVLFHGSVGQCKNVLFGAQGVMDKFLSVTDPAMRLTRNRMMTWDKVDAWLPGNTLFLVLETEAVQGSADDDEKSIINVRKTLGSNELLAKVLHRLIGYLKGWAQVHPDCLVAANNRAETQPQPQQKEATETSE